MITIGYAFAAVKKADPNSIGVAGATGSQETGEAGAMSHLRQPVARERTSYPAFAVAVAGFTAPVRRG
jgi:hypothetical protein